MKVWNRQNRIGGTPFAECISRSFGHHFQKPNVHIHHNESYGIHRHWNRN